MPRKPPAERPRVKKFALNIQYVGKVALFDKCLDNLLGTTKHSSDYDVTYRIRSAKYKFETEKQYDWARKAISSHPVLGMHINFVEENQKLGTEDEIMLD